MTNCFNMTFSLLAKISIWVAMLVNSETNPFRWFLHEYSTWSTICIKWSYNESIISRHVWTHFNRPSHQEPTTSGVYHFKNSPLHGRIIEIMERHRMSNAAILFIIAMNIKSIRGIPIYCLYVEGQKCTKLTSKKKCNPFDEICVIGGIGSCQNDNFRCHQWR